MGIEYNIITWIFAGLTSLPILHDGIKTKYIILSGEGLQTFDLTSALSTWFFLLNQMFYLDSGCIDRQIKTTAELLPGGCFYFFCHLLIQYFITVFIKSTHPPTNKKPWVTGA